MANSSNFVIIPIKKTWEIDFISPLKQFIKETYSSTSSEEYNASLTEINKLRNLMITKSLDKHESSLEVYYRYYDQLVAIEGKFPISENQIRINFKWQDVFDKETLFSGKKTLTIASGAYEKVCVLFNIAALQSQVAEAQNIASDDGLKLAAKYFQQSSGILSHLKSTVQSAIQGDITQDLYADVLNAMSALMLAQAQDCFVKKAMRDKMKPAIISKLAMQCSDNYVDASKLLQLESLRNIWPKDWTNIVAGKQSGYHAIAEYYQSQISKENKEFGEEIARLRHSKELLLASEMRSGVLFMFQDLQKKVNKALVDAEKDNDFIYHSKIPELSSLSQLAKAALAKVIPISNPMSKDFRDLFEKLVPLSVHHAVTAFENRRSVIVNGEIGKLRENTQYLNCALASMNLPASLEDLGGSEIPASLIAKSNELKQMGGYDSLKKLMTDLPILLRRNKEILDEADKLLHEEEESDNLLKSQFKERWTRTPSQKLNESISSEAQKFRTLINTAINADAIVNERFNTHKEDIELLSKSEEEIKSMLPSSSHISSSSQLPVVNELKGLIKQLDAMKKERDQIETDIKSAAASNEMTGKFLSALAQDGAINEEVLSSSSLDVTFVPIREKISKSINEQEDIMNKVQLANNKFSEEMGHNPTGALREEKLKKLAFAFDNFKELKSNLQEGTKFYNDLTEILIKFQNKISDFCFARKTEKDELMKDLSAGIARQAQAPAPAQPLYQYNKEENSSPKVPPTRPPPLQNYRPPITTEHSFGSTQQPSNYMPNGATNPYNPYPGGYPAGQQPPYPVPYGSMPYPVYPGQMPTGYNPYFQPPAQSNYQPFPQQNYQPYPNQQGYNAGYQPYPPYQPPQK